MSYLFQSTSKNVSSEPRVEGAEGEGEDETDAPTHQAAVPKKESVVLEEEIIDVSYFCDINQAVAMQHIKLQ